jgi:hypothetical protein
MNLFCRRSGVGSTSADIGLGQSGQQPLFGGSPETLYLAMRLFDQFGLDGGIEVRLQPSFFS